MKTSCASFAIASAAALAVVVAPAVTGAAAAAESSVAEIDEAAARRLLLVGSRARRAKQKASERRILRRALELDPDQSRARLNLGWKKRDGAWVRSQEAELDVAAWSDEDHAAGAPFRAAAAEVEDWRADRVVGLLEPDGIDDVERATLLSLLERAPSNDSVHRALDHHWTGGGWARPELVEAALRLDEREAEWAALRDLPVEMTSLDEIPPLDGAPLDGYGFDVDGTKQVVRLRLPASADRAGISATVAAIPTRTHALLATLYGDDVPLWSPPRAYLLDRAGYFSVVAAHIDDDALARRQRAQATFERDDFLVVWCGSPANARDMYAHTIAFRSAWVRLGPLDDTSPEAWDAHAWFKEGTAFLTTLEMLDSGDTWMFSHGGTSRKSEHALAPDAPRDRGVCLRYVRDHLIDGTALTLRQMFGRRLNDLNLLISLEAWTFLRFAAAYDPDGLRKLPTTLAAARDGSYAERGVAAVESAFGKDIDELERLWRAFTLEVR